MNEATKYIMGIYQVELMIRDTLEYVQNRQSYDLNFYNQRKAIILHGVENNSPLSNFLNQNGEVGEKIRENLKSFIDMVYSDDSTYITVDNGVLLVDHAQDIQCLDYIVGLKETLCDVVKKFIEQTKVDKANEEDLAVMVALDEQFYRVLSSLVVFDKIHDAFLEFNKVMQENKGQPSPQSNFVINDLKRLVGFERFLNEHSDKNDKDYQTAFEHTFLCLNYMEGSKPLPGTSGMKQEIDNVHNEYVSLLGPREEPWRLAYSKIWAELVEFEKNQQQNKNVKN